MDYEKYKKNESEFESIKTLKGEFRRFDPNKDQISMYKLIFILPNGECLLMPYDENDEREGLQNRQYNHIAYIAKAIDLILEKLGIDKETFVRTKIEKFNTDELIAAILNLKISFFYEMGNTSHDGELLNYTIFMKPVNITEKQEKELLYLKESLTKERYVISINILNSDETYRKNEDIKYAYDREKTPIRYICYEDGRFESFDVDEFYKLINVSREPNL